MKHIVYRRVQRAMRFFASVALGALALVAFAQKAEVPDANIDSLIERLRKDDDPYRASYFDRAALFNWPRVMWHYRKGDGSLRSRIVLLAAWPRNPVWEAAHADPEPNIRRTVLNLDVISKNALPAKLIRKWLRDPSEPNRVYALLLAHYAKQDRLMRSMFHDPSPLVRVEAALKFAYAKEREALNVLAENIEFLLPDYARYGNMAYVSCEDDRVIGHLCRIGPAVLPSVRPLLKSKDMKKRQSAVTVVGQVKGPGYFEDLRSMVADLEPSVRYTVYWQLALSRRKEAIPILVKALEEPGYVDPEGRSPIAANVRYLLAGGAFDDNPWPEGAAALEAYDRTHPKKPG